MKFITEKGFFHIFGELFTSEISFVRHDAPDITACGLSLGKEAGKSTCPEQENFRNRSFTIENMRELIKTDIFGYIKMKLYYWKLWKQGISNFLLILFLIFVNILMLNMLIALFTNTYARIEAESKINLAIAKFSIVVSMTHTLPFSVLNPFIQLLIFIWAFISVPIAIITSG